MLKKFIVLSLILSSSLLAEAHCGGCGVGGSKEKTKTHHAKDKMNVKDLKLNKSQIKKHKSIMEEYKKEAEALRVKYNDQFIKILDSKQKETYSKEGNDACLICDKK